MTFIQICTTIFVVIFLLGFFLTLFSFIFGPFLYKNRQTKNIQAAALEADDVKIKIIKILMPSYKLKYFGDRRFSIW